MKRKNAIILGILVAISIVLGLWRFWVMFQEWKHTKEELISLQIEYYRTSQELADSQKQIDTLKEQVSSLEGSNKQLSKQKQELQEKMAKLEEEKQAIEARLHSLKELKKAIREVKIEMREQDIRQYFSRKEQQREMDAQELALGNRGFTFKGGQTTYKSNIRIEVKPAD